MLKHLCEEILIFSTGLRANCLLELFEVLTLYWLKDLVEMGATCNLLFNVDRDGGHTPLDTDLRIFVLTLKCSTIASCP